MNTESRPSLLLVHKTPGSHSRIVAFLRAAGVACAEARSAEEAFAVLSALRFDFVLVDPPSPELELKLKLAHPGVRSLASNGDAAALDPAWPGELEPAELLRRLR